MTKSKPRKRRSWWRRKRAQRWLGVSVAALAVVIAVAVVAWRGQQSGEPPQYFTEPAPAFTLPTIAGEQVSLSEHVGRHVVLLYFNEGMG